MKKRILITTLAAVLAAAPMTVYASGWQKDANGWWYENDDGTWLSNTWAWLDGNNDGIAECYCFDKNGYMYVDTQTPDLYKVNADGQWFTDEGIQTYYTYYIPKPVYSAQGLAEQMISAINSERQKTGRTAYTENKTISKAAQIRAEECLAQEMISHVRPDGTNGYDILTETWPIAGENLAQANYQISGNDVVKNWMTSDIHRLQIMGGSTGSYNEVGIGIATDANGGWYYVALFADTQP